MRTKKYYIRTEDLLSNRTMPSGEIDDREHMLYDADNNFVYYRRLGYPRTMTKSAQANLRKWIANGKVEPIEHDDCPKWFQAILEESFQQYVQDMSDRNARIEKEKQKRHDRSPVMKGLNPSLIPNRPKSQRKPKQELYTADDIRGVEKLYEKERKQ